MKTARIVVLAIAFGAGGIAASPANAAGRAIELHTLHLTRAMASRVDRGSPTGATINIVRFGVAVSTPGQT